MQIECKKMGDKGMILIILFRGARYVQFMTSQRGSKRVVAKAQCVYGLQRERPLGELRDGYYLRQLRRQA